MKKFLANTLVVLTLALTLVVSGDVTTADTDGNTNTGIETLSDGPGLHYPQPKSDIEILSDGPGLHYPQPKSSN